MKTSFLTFPCLTQPQLRVLKDLSHFIGLTIEEIEVLQCLHALIYIILTGLREGIYARLQNPREVQMAVCELGDIH